MPDKPVDMALTKEEMKNRTDMPTVASSKSKGPKYPWGLEIRLDEKSMEKLGMDDLPEVGELCQITGIGRVVAVSQRESQDASSKDVTIQIEKLDLEVQEESAEEESREADKAFEKGVRKGRGRSSAY